MDVMQQRPPDDVSDEDMPDVVCHPDEPALQETDYPPNASPSALLLQPPSTPSQPNDTTASVRRVSIES